MRNHTKVGLNFSEVGIEDSINKAHNFGENEDINEIYKDFEDKFDDSDLEIKPEYVEKIKKITEEDKVIRNVNLDDYL